MPPAIWVSAALASLYGWALLAPTFWRPGSIGLNLNTPGTDWMVFYGAARSFFDGNLGLIFDGDKFTAYLNSTFSWWLSQPMPFRPWVYPPSYLLAVLPFGELPFAVSYFAFQLVGAALLTAALTLGSNRSYSAKLVTCSALLCPAAAINIAVGQNAFFTSALLVAGVLFLQTRPRVAGALLGVLTLKPQFWVLVPVALIAARNWRALVSTAVAAVALAVASAAVLGIEAWRQWADLAMSTYSVPNAKWIEYGRMWGTSVYACIVSVGGSETAANAGQAAAVLIAAAATYRAFRVPLPVGHKIAVLLTGTILAAPHSSLHDAVLLAVAGVLWVSETTNTDVLRWRWPLVLSLWLVPLFNPPLISPVSRLTPVLIITFIAVVVAGGRSLAAQHGAPGASSHLSRGTSADAVGRAGRHAVVAGSSGTVDSSVARG